VRFEILTAMKIQVAVFWVVTPFNDVVGYKRLHVPLKMDVARSS
jgi:hypothetical protein